MTGAISYCIITHTKSCNSDTLCYAIIIMLSLLPQINSKFGLTGVKITVSHWSKTDQFSKIAAHFLVWFDIFQIKEGLAYTVVLTCVVGLADITFSVAWRLTNQVGPLCTIM